jgi:RNA polymerase sigma-70 factor (ECF subfamily)
MACTRRFSAIWAMRPRVVDFIRRQGFRGPAAEDVASDVFLVAWRRLEHVPLAEGAAVGWLYQTARHTMRNHWRAARRETVLWERAGHENGVIAAGRIENVELRRLDALDAWRTLSTTDRDVLAQVATSGPTIHGLAAILGTSGDAAAKRLSRARQRLESIWADDAVGDNDAAGHDMAASGSGRAGHLEGERGRSVPDVRKGTKMSEPENTGDTRSDTGRSLGAVVAAAASLPLAVGAFAVGTAAPAGAACGDNWVNTDGNNPVRHFQAAAGTCSDINLREATVGQDYMAQYLDGSTWKNGSGGWRWRDPGTANNFVAISNVATGTWVRATGASLNAAIHVWH